MLPLRVRGSWGSVLVAGVIFDSKGCLQLRVRRAHGALGHRPEADGAARALAASWYCPLAVLNIMKSLRPGAITQWHWHAASATRAGRRGGCGCLAGLGDPPARGPGQGEAGATELDLARSHGPRVAQRECTGGKLVAGHVDRARVRRRGAQRPARVAALQGQTSPAGAPCLWRGGTARGDRDPRFPHWGESPSHSSKNRTTRFPRTSDKNTRRIPREIGLTLVKSRELTG